jgi:putative DNA primase/helicase
MIGAVARVLRPGCKMDNVLMLEGDQGRGKSTSLSILGGDWFTDTPFELGSKDGFLAMRGKWIIELAELDSFNRAESTRAKHFFAADKDTYREPYGRRVIDVHRQCVFAGSTNTNEYLKDDTGNRRYWPVTTGAIDKDGLIRDRDQIWAEAVHEFKAGETWWFEPGIDFVQAEQEQRFVTDAWEELVSTYVFEKKKDQLPSSPIPFYVSVGEVLNNCLGLRPSDWERKHQMRVSSILKRMNMIRRQIRDESDNRIWVYMPKFRE